MNWARKSFILVISLLVISHCTPVFAKDYDGIWFLGFDLTRDPFSNLKVRQAVAHCLDKDYIVTTIMSNEAVPGSFIPPGLLGYASELKPYRRNVEYAKALMRQAKYSVNDKELKNISLLHTDGVKTIAIAEKIREDLKKIGMNIKLVQISYKDQEKWDRELNSGKHHMFLMGYKAGIENLFLEGTMEAKVDGYSLLEPLFKTNGAANFTNFTNTDADQLFEQIEVLDPTLSQQRGVKLKAINKLLYKELPAIILFYIEKL